MEEVRSEIAEEYASGLDSSGASIATRDDTFCARAFEILSRNPEEKVLIMVGYAHLPYMIDHFIEKGFTCNRQ